MKKFFLIPLMTLMCSVMAWGTEIEVSTFDALKTQLSASGTADVVKLANNIAYPSNGGSDLLDIQRSLTLDGNGYKLSGYAVRGAHTGQGNNGQYNKVTLVINHQAAHSGLTVTLKNVEITENESLPTHTVGVFVYDGVDSLAIVDNSTLRRPGANSNATPLALYGESSTPLKILVRDSKVLAGTSSYGVVVLKPIKAYFENSTFSGYSSMTFKLPLGLYPGNRWTVGFGTANIGARGSVINATNSNFEAPNVHSGYSNDFGTLVFEEDGIDMNFTNCGFNAEALGNAGQSTFLLNGAYVTKDHETQDINITIAGDNTHFNGKYITGDFYKCRVIQNGADKGVGYENGYVDGTVTIDKYTSSDINVTIKGGTYSINPDTYEFNAHVSTSDPHYSDGAAKPTVFTKRGFTIPDDYEVKTIVMEGVANPLYRVVKKAAEKEPGVLYDLNDNVETAGNGQNPATSFDLKTGTAMTLNQPTTKAGYVEVKDHATKGATTVTVAKNDVNPEQSQTLVINNGLDVQGESQVIVEPTAALVIGEGGIVTSKPENIIIQADEDGAASLLLDPTITVNQTPELTVKMTVPAEHAGYEMLGSDKYRHWFRFAMPVAHMAATWVKNPNIPTYLYGWDYANQKWAQVDVTSMVPFAGYTLSPDQEITNGAITYTFKGQLLGNTNCTLNLNHHGYNFFGNSYTGYISILKLVDQIMGDAKIDGTVWMWDGEKYEGIGLEYLRQYGAIEPSWKKEVAPMQTFVLRLTGDDFSSTDINYADAIWGNPRYDNAKSALNAAPARRAEINDDAIIRMTIEANGQKESVVMIENSNYSDAYDRGYDAIKYMNENCFNTYVGVNGENYGTVATDNLDGKMLSIKTNNELAYSITFDFVAGEEYALRDNLTGKVIAIEEGATYEFAAQPNSTVEGRFEIVGRAKMPTAIENTEVKANVKGIYTIMGQYLGEDFDILPAGVYVVNGVKIVK